MFCRRALQRVRPLARRAFPPGARHAPGRHMSFGVPSSSSNLAYVVLGGGGLTAAVVYAYKTVRGDSEPHEDRLASMAPADEASEVAAPEADPVVVEQVEEAAPAPEVVAESAPAVAEPEAEAVAEPVVESEAAEVEAAPAAEVEAVPVSEEEVVVVSEAPAEAPESMPDRLLALKLLAGSPVEMAAASVGDTSLGRAVADGKSLDFTPEAVEPEGLEATTKMAAEEEEASAPKEEKVVEEEASAPEEEVEELVVEEASPQPAAASSGSDLQVLAAAGPEAEAPSSAAAVEVEVEVEVVAPPAASGVQCAGEEVVDIIKEVEELVEGQTSEALVAVAAQS
ncbi:brain acid soluble protein 1-like isoform X2 [Pseudoliparis swirei]|uniref:brain acid soluble protein 1-like isoform X2 n=1 Tax=Pseudoliparis swirei TaxID=2059687 RepID=UPI0024BD9FEE|nr:brain acid soluble protein 1-like isoform X2 [Pseudoliparis swirei]